MERMIEICQILLPYCTCEAKEYGFWAEHDVVGFNIDPDIIPEDILKKLEDEYRVHYDNEYNSLVIYV